MKGPSEPGQFARNKTLRPYELALLCRVDPKTINLWSREGKLPSLQTLGGHRRYLRRDLEFLPAEGDPQLLTYAEFAAMMSVKPGAVGEWVQKGKLRPVVLPGRYPRLVRSEVVQLLGIPGDPG